LQDMKLQDKIRRQEIAGHEHEGPKMTAGREIAEKKHSFNRDNITMKCVNF